MYVRQRRMITNYQALGQCFCAIYHEKTGAVKDITRGIQISFDPLPQVMLIILN
ncbi:hypothetical protein ACFLXD_00675 [Chloroflexota bacterium]